MGLKTDSSPGGITSSSNPLDEAILSACSLFSFFSRRRLANHMHIMRAMNRAARVQPTTMPTRALTDRVTPWLLLSLSAVNDDEMMGDAGTPGLGVDDVVVVEKNVVVASSESRLSEVAWSVGLEI